MDKTRAPLYEAMIEQAERNCIRLHVPGHMGKSSDAADFSESYRAVRQIDFTEIEGLDDLHHPTGVIADAQMLAADCFGAEETSFLVGGSTVGNLAIITAVCGPGDVILMQRNVHKSALHGLMLAGAAAVFLPPLMDPQTGLAIGVHPEQLEQALERYPEAKAVFVTNPNYYGMGIDLRPLAEMAHSRGIPLLVDEAHGAHYGFQPDFPRSALSCGADAVVQSTHKMLTAMTMGAMLHLQGDLLDRSEIKRRLAMLQSSSPSYPIMASLDLARRRMHMDGERSLTQANGQADALRQQLSNDMPEYGMIKINPAVFQTLDPLKLSIRDRTGALSGFRLQDELRKEGCVAEMADPVYVLLHLGLDFQQKETNRLRQALQNISARFQLKKKEILRESTNKYIIPPVLANSPPVSFDSLSQRARMQATVPVQAAVDRLSAGLVIPYPPGIPILYTGERITQEMAAYIQSLMESGARFQGAVDADQATISVFADKAYTQPNFSI